MNPIVGLGLAQLKLQAVQGLERIRLLVDEDEEQFINHLRQAAFGPPTALPLPPFACPRLVRRIDHGISCRKGGQQLRKLFLCQASRGQKLSRSIL